MISSLAFLGWTLLFLLLPTTLFSQKEDGEEIGLPEPVRDGGKSVEHAISLRRSTRFFTKEPLDVAQVGQLLWAAQGITDGRNRLRAAPSAGALYPVEIFLLARNVKGLPPGIYWYAVERHSLRPTLTGDRHRELRAAALEQSAISSAPACFVITAVYERTMRKYGNDRGRRYAIMDGAAAGENLLLQASSLGLGSVMIGAFDDEGVKAAMQLPADWHPLLIIPVGMPG